MSEITMNATLLESIKGCMAGKAQRLTQMSKTLGVDTSEILPLLTPFNGIQAGEKGWFKLAETPVIDKSTNGGEITFEVVPTDTVGFSQATPVLPVPPPPAQLPTPAEAQTILDTQPATEVPYVRISFREQNRMENQEATTIVDASHGQKVATVYGRSPMVEGKRNDYPLFPTYIILMERSTELFNELAAIVDSVEKGTAPTLTRAKHLISDVMERYGKVQT